MGFFLLGGLALAAFALLSPDSENKKHKKKTTEKENSTTKDQTNLLIDEFNTYVEEQLKKKIKEFKWITVGEISRIHNTYHQLFLTLLQKKQNTDKELDFINNYKTYFTNNGKSIDIESLVLHINNAYITKELEENKELFDNIDGKSLDYQQRMSAIIDDNRLVVAGAGAGKTLTIAGTVKYLVQSKNIDPKDILLITYTKKAAEEMKERIVDKLNVNVDVYTFHALGNKIIREVEEVRQSVLHDPFHKKFFEYLKKDEDFLLKILQFNLSYNKKTMEGIKISESIASRNEKYRDIIIKSQDKDNPLTDEEQYIIKKVKDNDKIYNNKKIKDNELITYLENIENNYSPKNLRTLKDFFLDSFYKNKENKTWSYDFVKSHEELLIANYLFRNSIKYEYEKPYEIDTATKQYRQYHPDFYLPEYNIYLEHFGINRNGRTPQYTPEEEKIYLDGIKWKRNIHKINHTKLVESYSYEFSEGKFPQNLHDKLEKEGVVFSPIPSDTLKRFTEDIEREIKHKNTLFKLFFNFLTLFRNSNYSYEHFQEIIEAIISEHKFSFSNAIKNKEIFFIEITKELYKLYKDFLTTQKCIDFSDMINKAIVDLNNYNKDYKYIIIDEYQDTSKIKCDLIVKLKNKNKECKVMVVGDDWQSIYRFEGNDLNLFIHFDKYLGAGLKLNIENTYRNSQELIKIAGDFVMKNELQMKKNLKSNIHLNDLPIKGIEYTRQIGSYTAYDKNGEAYEVQTQTDLHKYFDLIVKDILNKNPKAKTIMILGRYSFDAKLLYTEVELKKEAHKTETKIKYKDYDFDFKSMTIHGSKGLEADEVILLINDKDNLGFPSNIEDDPIFRFVLSTPEKYPYAEERRLFYVATTRTKNRVYIKDKKQSIYYL